MAAMTRLFAGLLLAALPSLCEAAGSKNPFSPDMAPDMSTTTGPPAKYASYAIVHSTNKKVFGDMWEKRALQSVDLANRSDVAYYAKLNIGNPPQPNYVQLDTGSFELWVNPNCSNLRSSTDRRFCDAVGSYDPSESKSSRRLSGTKTLQYGIGSADIQYVTDDIGFADSNNTLRGVQFGVATATEDEFSGILGIGHGLNVTIPYRNFVDELAAQNVTQTKAFSLALGGKREEEGVIIFGGMDTKKFAGPLATLPILPAAESPDRVPRYWVKMAALALTPPSGRRKTYANSTDLAVFLDSGATLTLLPTALADAVAADFGARGTDLNGFYSVDCALAGLGGSLDFEFPGVNISVPYAEMIREIPSLLGTVCYLGISPSEDFVLLGDTMLRSAYAIFDQTNDVIHLAPYVNCGKNEVEITPFTNMTTIKGDCDMPERKGTKSSSSTTASSSASATVSPTGNRASTAAAAPTPTGDADDNGSTQASETDESVSSLLAVPSPVRAIVGALAAWAVAAALL